MKSEPIKNVPTTRRSKVTPVGDISRNHNIRTSPTAFPNALYTQSIASLKRRGTFSFAEAARNCQFTFAWAPSSFSLFLFRSLLHTPDLLPRCTRSGAAVEFPNRRESRLENLCFCRGMSIFLQVRLSLYCSLELVFLISSPRHFWWFSISTCRAAYTSVRFPMACVYA